MAKYFGKIGYATLLEQDGSIWEEDVIEKTYYGDVIRHSARYESADQLNDNVKLNDEISIIADDFAFQNTHRMRYVTHLGVKWKITNISVGYPRITLAFGGVYNGPEPSETTETGQGV